MSGYVPMDFSICQACELPLGESDQGELICGKCNTTWPKSKPIDSRDGYEFLPVLGPAHKGSIPCEEVAEPAHGDFGLTRQERQSVRQALERAWAFWEDAGRGLPSAWRVVYEDDASAIATRAAGGGSILMRETRGDGAQQAWLLTAKGERVVVRTKPTTKAKERK